MIPMRTDGPLIGAYVRNFESMFGPVGSEVRSEASTDGRIVQLEVGAGQFFFLNRLSRFSDVAVSACM